MYNNNVRIAKKIAIGTIISGIIFLTTLYLTYNFTYAIGGLFFGLGVALIVITIMISGLIAANRQNHNPKEKTSPLIWHILSLVAIAVFTVLGLFLVNSVQIVINNQSDQTIQNIFITGCQNNEIESIPAKSKKTIWVNYCKNKSEECGIGIRYTTATDIVDKVLIDEIKLFQGEKIEHIIP